MEKKSWLYKATAWAVTIGLLLQSFPFWVGLNWASQPALAQALEEGGQTAVSTPTAPLAIARSQSSYASGENLVVTYTVHNSLPPTQAPDVVPGQTLTDTLAVLDNFDPLADPNTLRQVIVTFEPTAASFVDASLPASLANGVYTFLLDDIPPLASATLVIELDGPVGVTDPTELDSGAVGWGMVNGRAHQASSPPAILWPDSMGDWLACTLDANCDDPYVIEQAAQLGQNPDTLFTFVRDLGFESYSGSLRGARGTLWSAAGNSTDQASLLIALLRASGVPARYRSGELANPDIETLILSMFPQPPGVIGYLPADSPFPLADPLQNEALWPEIRDHFWVEAYLPGLGWTDLDPAFAAAEIGDRYVNEPDPVALAELPADLRHSVNLRLKVEKYHPLSGLTHSYPLDYAFSAVELVGRPVSLGHMVQSQNQGGLIFANVFHTYTPYLALAGAATLLEGEPFQELFTNFPLGTSIVTGEWLLIDLHHPAGPVESYEREIFDAIGYEARFNGGTVHVGGDGRTNEPFVSELSLFTGLFAPSFIPVAAVDREFAAAATAVTEGQSAYDRVNEIMADGEVDPDETDDLITAVQSISRMTRASQRVLLMQHAAAADFGTQRLADAFLVRPYYDAPRVHLMAWETDTVSGRQTVNLDLRRNKVRALPHPGQSLRGWQAFNVAYGLAAMSLESDLLQRFSPDAPVKSVANMLTAAQEQDIPLVIISPANLADLADLTISDEAKARITVDLMQNPRHFVIVPAAPVTLGDEETVGWLRSDIVSGETIDVSEEGLHLVAVEYAIKLNSSFQEIGFAIAGFGQGFAGFTFVFLGEFLGGIPGDMKEIWNAALSAAEQWASDTAELLAEMYEHDWVEAFINGVGLHGGGSGSVEGVGEWSFGEFDWRVGGFNNGASFAASVIGEADPPLPPALAARLPEHQFHRTAVGQVNAPASGSGTAVSANLLLQSLNAQGTLTAEWENTAQSGLRFRQLSGQGELYANGSLVGNGAVTAAADNNQGQIETDGTIVYHSSGAGGVGFYAPAVAGLGSGAFWGDTTVTLTPDSTAELTLRGATATLNGQVYSGTLTLVTTAPVTLEAGGPAAAPHFAGSASLAASGSTLALPPAAGSVTIGDTAVSLQDGLSLPNFSGSMTVSEADSTTDAVTLSGDAHYFRLALDPAASTTTPGDPVTFQADITANFSDSYTVTLSAPGWAAAVAADGSLTVTPTLATAPGDYTLLVTAQSSLYPTAVSAAEHLVTINAMQGVEVTIQPDPIYTIPWGEPDHADNTTTNNGQVQIPDAAYAVQIVNRSSQPQPFDVSVSGLNPDWLIFAGQEGQTTTQITLPAGGTTWLGLYVRPDTAVLPAPGNSYPFTVTAVAVADPGVNDSDSATFVMPAVPFQQLWVEPANLYTTPQSAAEFAIHLHNIGNTAGSFDLAASLPDGWWLDDLQTAVDIDAGQTAGQVVTLNVADAQAGRSYPVNIVSPVPGMIYRQTATLNVYLVSAAAAPIYNAAEGCLADEQPLASALNALALGVDSLAASCEDGDCALPLRDQVVNTAYTAAGYAYQSFPPMPGIETLELAADQLSGTNDSSQIETILLDMATAVSTMETELCAILSHRPTISLSPWMKAALPGQTAVYDLALTNQGGMTTTYAVTMTLPNETLTFAQTLLPGTTLTTAVPVSTTQLGLHTVQASATVLELEEDLPPLTAAAQATLNVVDRFVQVIEVAADPSFVETGVSTTTLRAEVANVAGLRQEVTAEAAVLSPGGLVRWSDAIPLTILTGSPRLYALGEVETSGWGQGIYTITLTLVDNGGLPIPGGSGHGYLIVGQGLHLSHSASPQLVAPGSVTVTTAVTTTVMRPPTTTLAVAPAAVVANGPRDLSQYPEATDSDEEAVTMDDEQLLLVAEELNEPEESLTDEELSLDYGRPVSDEELSPVNEEAGSPDESIIPDNQTLNEATASLLTTHDSLLRYEQDALTYTGSWSTINQAWTSGGQTARSLTAGDSASFTFNGTWVGIGFNTGMNNGHAEIFLNGESQGIVDTYSRYNDVTAVYMGDLISATHTISITVLGTRNPFASNHRVEIDYVDVWDGTPLPDGSFEENDAHVYLSNGWVTVSEATASGGEYIRSQFASTHTNAWFHFTGDSVSFQALAYNGAGLTKILIDNELQGVFDLYSGTPVTRTFSFDNLGSGAHVVQITSYRGRAAVDRFVTPGQAPFYHTPVPEGFTRYEEDDPALLYNGVPFTQTATSWNMGTLSWASAGYGTWSNTAGDTVSLTFDGEWVSLGLTTRSNAGLVEVFIDGESQGIVDTYSRYDDVLTLNYELTPGTHTISMTVLGIRNDFSSADWVRLDYIDVWDGTAVPDGSFEENDERVYLSPGWVTVNEGAASGGQYSRSQFASTHTNAWFNFVGDSVTFQALAYNGAGMTRIAIDGEVIGIFDLYSATTMTRTFSFDNLGPGAHVLELRDYRGRATIDRFVTPGEAPFYEPPVREGIVRYEEDDPALLYNGLPWEQTAPSWNMATYGWSSGGYGMWSDTAGDTISLTFDGEWVSVGLITRNTAGLAEIFIDGESQGVVDTYGRNDDLLTLTYDLTPGTHTITVTVLGQTGAFNTQRYVRLDYIDVWDGTAVPDGSFEENDERVYLAGGWTNLNDANASDGRYIRSNNGHAWFHFMGDSFSYQAIPYASGGKARLHVDGRYLDTINLNNPTLITRTFSYEGFGPGPHVLQVSTYRGNTTIDAFSSPGQAPFIDPTFLPPGIVRYEEDHPTILYNGAPYTRTATSWIREDSGFSARASDAQYIRSGAAGDTISFDFTGSWVGVGMVTNNVAGHAEIAVDGDVLEVVDLYTPGNGMLSRYYDGLGEGAHTLTITVLGTSHPDSGDTRVYLDYIDVWDGTPMPDGVVEEWDERIHYSAGWAAINEGAASDGRYARSSNTTTYVNAWFPFSGDSVSYQALAYNGAGQVDVSLDGVLIGRYDLFNSTAMTRTFSFGGLGDGPHVLQLEYNTGRVTLDRFDQPGTAPFIPHYQVGIIPVTAFPGGRSGGTAVQTINLHNQGIQPDTYDLTISGAAWATEVISTVHLSPTEIRPIQITTAVPPGMPLGASDSFTITAVSQTDDSVTAIETLQTYAVNVDAQLCIAMDGSGSISAAEFQLMVGGLAAAMRDNTAVPRNATIEFSIVQFAGSTRTEIAPVVIVNEDAAEWVAQQIEQISQISGGTPMQDAVDLCTDLLMNSPHTSHALRQVINMVTDGEPNNVSATNIARNNAISAGVDQINAEAIGVTEAAVAFLRDELVYPEPGYEAPPFIPGQGGFVIRADSFEEFVESIGQKVNFALDTGYTIELDHHVPLTAVQLITNTITPPPDAITGTPAADTLHWVYSLIGADNSRSHTLQTVLPDMQPGETRAVSLGTEVYYRLSGGENWLSLPPLYVTAARIIEIMPEEQMASVGSTAVYTLTLHNPGQTDDLYSLHVLGLPVGWLDYPTTVSIPAQSSVEVLLEVHAPANADLAERPFAVTVSTGSEGQDMATASLSLFNGLEIVIEPPLRSAPTGTAVTYTLTLTNYQLSTATYQLSTAGLAQVELPDDVIVGANTTVSIPITITGTAHGPQPFTVMANSSSGSGTADALLIATGHYAVGLALDPESEGGGPGTPAEFSLTVTNLGDAPDGYDLMLDVPAGWSATLDANGTPVDSLILPPYLLNSADLRLLVTPDLAAVPGDYEISATAVSHSRPGVQTTISGTVEILPLGVTLSISPQQTSMNPLDSAVWQVTITNTASVADSYDLAAAGIVGLTAEFSSDTVTLNPGQSQTVQLSAGPMPLVLPQSYPFWVTAVSQADQRIANEAEATITFTGYEGVEVAWLPPSQTVVDTLSAGFLLVITNTGNVPTTYQLGLTMPGLSSLMPAHEISLPARAAAVLPVRVKAGGAGVYTLTALAQSSEASDSATATLTILMDGENQPPIVDAGPDQTAVVNTVVQFNGSASDPDGDPLTFAWNFGDGNGASGTLTPSHGYQEIGLYTVTLTVSDTFGHVVSDTLQVTVVAEELFAVDAGLDREGNEGSQIAFSGVITDTGSSDPYLIEWNFGDGSTAEGSLTPSHAYADNGIYTVTLTVTNSESQVASDTLLVTVHNVAPTVTAAVDQHVGIGETVSAILATFSDPGWLDTHTAVIDWGDGTVTAGVVDQTAQTVSGAHTYTATGVYTVTIMVTDNDGDQGSDTLQITVGPYQLYLPLMISQ
ncbi:MAG: PKD domain-containing protein [Chloroflexota bacterium]